jgi:DNA-binding HxlR family transcriptional regulator
MAARLSTLVEFDVLEKRSYRAEGERERSEYLLTGAGRDLGIDAVESVSVPTRSPR